MGTSDEIKREKARDFRYSLQAERNRLAEKVNTLTEELKKYTELLGKACEDFEIASKSAEQLQNESTEELENNIIDIDTINTKIRANLEKEKAEIDAESYKKQYDTMSGQIEQLREEKMMLLKSANLPLPGLSVEDGELTYNGFKWDAMSGADQLKVSTAIVRKLNPECGFVLLDKLEQMDVDTLNEFGKWLEAEGLQAIATRVSTGDECSIIIEDGYVVTPGSETVHKVQPETQKQWKEGEF